VVVPHQERHHAQRRDKVKSWLRVSRRRRNRHSGSTKMRQEICRNGLFILGHRSPLRGERRHDYAAAAYHRSYSRALLRKLTVPPVSTRQTTEYEGELRLHEKVANDAPLYKPETSVALGFGSLRVFPQYGNCAGAPGARVQHDEHYYAPSACSSTLSAPRTKADYHYPERDAGPTRNMISSLKSPSLRPRLSRLPST
jgi:hypothetical protein